MALTQFMSEWNDLFELKVSVGDIKKPTQSFLYGVLDFFLGTMHIDCDKIKAKMDERGYKIWLIRYYNDFFKACNPKGYPLYYVDLLQPESKKALEILRFLLNFHLFHNAVQKEIVEMASSNIEMYNHWLAKKNQLQLSQEEAKIQSEQKETMLKETTHWITEYKQQLDELIAKNNLLTKETEEARQQIYAIRVQNIDLMSQKDGMAPSIVTEHELASLFKSIQNTDNEIAELNAMETDIRSKNQCFSQEMSKLSGEIEELSTNINENSVIESVEKNRDEMKTLTELNNKVKELQSHIENSITHREELVEGIKSLEAQLLTKRNDLCLLLQSCQSKIMSMESACKRGSTQAANEGTKYQLLEQKIEKLKVDQDQLIAMGIQVIDYIENDRYSTKQGKIL